MSCTRTSGTVRPQRLANGRVRGVAGPPDGTAEAALVRYADLAREHGVLATPVPDSLHPKRFVSVASIHGRMLLYGLIGGTASGRERECAYDLAALWEAKVRVTWLPAGLTRALTRADLPPSADPH